MAAAAAWVLLAPPAGQAAEASPDAALILPTAGLGQTASSATAEPAPTMIVVDVEGAVAAPGIRELPAGSRVADALDAAGGYAADADLEAAAASINLAQRLEDGVQIVVPRVGAQPAAVLEEEAGGETGGGAGRAAGAPVNLNTASAEELEALPGIGPVTVERIIQAREERPFASLEDAVARGAIDRGQAEDIEGLATAS
jgi:competence protein ComEA